MPLVTAHKNATLDAMLGTGATLLNSTLEMGLSTTTPTADGTNITEPSAGGYTRVTLANTNAVWAPAAAGIKTNAADVIFPEATAGWGLITHWIIYSLGVPKIVGILDNGSGIATPLDVITGKVPRFLASAIRVEF